MTIRVGANPSGQMYVGIQTGVSAASVVASGTITMALGLSAASYRRLFGSGDIDLPAGPAFQLIHQHPVIRRGPGAVSLGNLRHSGAAYIIGHIHATGTLTLTASLSGTARRRSQASGDIALRFSTVGIGEVNGARIGSGTLTFSPVTLAGAAIVKQFTVAAGQLPLLLSLVGAGVRHLWVSASGALSLGTLTLKDIVPTTTTQVIPIDGLFLDATLEGVFVESIQIEGAT